MSVQPPTFHSLRGVCLGLLVACAGVRHTQENGCHFLLSFALAVHLISSRRAWQQSSMGIMCAACWPCQLSLPTMVWGTFVSSSPKRLTPLCSRDLLHLGHFMPVLLGAHTMA